MDYKIVNTEFKSTSDFEFEGYASVFGNIDDGDDIMQYGAFSKTINENMKRIKVLYMHRYTDLIGKPSILSEDSKGLYFKARVSKTTLGKDVMTLINDKVLDEMSIGYNVVKYARDADTGFRTLQEVRLWEISPVTWGMNSLANIKSIMQLNADHDILKEQIKILIQKAGGNATFKDKPFIAGLNPDITSLISQLDKYK
jgi:HK97 family phage prohead protease